MHECTINATENTPHIVITSKVNKLVFAISEILILPFTIMYIINVIIDITPYCTNFIIRDRFFYNIIKYRKHI